MHHSLKEPSLSSPVNAGLVYLKIFFQLVPILNMLSREMLAFTV